MFIAKNSRPIKALRRVARAFGRDSRGVAAVEFGYIVPVILLMLIGTIEICRALAVDRRYSMVTSMVADLVGREQSLTADDVKAIYNIVGQAMRPFDTAPLKISLIPVEAFGSAKNTRVYAGVKNRPSFQGGEQPPLCSEYPLASGLVDKDGTVIVVKTSYDYTPLLIGNFFGSSRWTEEAIVSPRKRRCVDFDNTNCVSPCI